MADCHAKRGGGLCHALQRRKISGQRIQHHIEQMYRVKLPSVITLASESTKSLSQETAEINVTSVQTPSITSACIP